MAARKAAPAAPKRPRGRPPHVPTDITRSLVSAILSVGGTVDDCAREIGIDPTVLRRYYRAEIDHGKRRVHMRIGLGVTQRALAGDNACSFFILKTQAGWRETSRQELTGPNNGPIPVAVEGKVTVYIPANGRDDPPASKG